jgi:hypothetical protein
VKKESSATKNRESDQKDKSKSILKTFKKNISAKIAEKQSAA